MVCQVWLRQPVGQGLLLLSNLVLYKLSCGAPFVTSILLLTEATFVQQKLLLPDKSNFVYDLSTFVRQKLILSDKITFV